METLSVRQARRLALVRAGLLLPPRQGLPRRARGKGKRALEAALAVVRRFGYLQLDTVSVAGARSHAIVLASRIEGLDAALGEELLRPGIPLFEYWGHEACWLPLELYPALEFRRRDYREHPWWGDVLGEQPELAEAITERICEEGPLRSSDFEGRGSGPWWGLKPSKKILSALWSAGRLAVRERRQFHRVFDLVERVIPEEVRRRPASRAESFRRLVAKALDGHGWATEATLAATWRFRNHERKSMGRALEELLESGRAVRCSLRYDSGREVRGWIRPEDLELAAALDRARPRAEAGVLLSPFDPLLWDRSRVAQLFSFEQLLEIFKPVSQRRYGYYCLPVLAGEALVARVDLKARRREGRLDLLSLRFEERAGGPRPTATAQRAVATALYRFADAVGLGRS